jgi:hypothetical protein
MSDADASDLGERDDPMGESSSTALSPYLDLPIRNASSGRSLQLNRALLIVGLFCLTIVFLKYTDFMIKFRS